jgi:hypothetical protein
VRVGRTEKVELEMVVSSERFLPVDIFDGQNQTSCNLAQHLPESFQLLVDPIRSEHYNPHTPCRCSHQSYATMAQDTLKLG